MAYGLNFQMGQMPFMRKITIPECKYFSSSINRSRTGIIHSHPISVLILRQHFIYCNRNELSVFITEPKSHRRNFSVCIGTGNHLHRNIDAQYAFQNIYPFQIFYSLSDNFIIICERIFVNRQCLGKIFYSFFW